MCYAIDTCAEYGNTEVFLENKSNFRFECYSTNTSNLTGWLAAIYIINENTNDSIRHLLVNKNPSGPRDE